MNTNDIQISLPPSKSISNRWLILNYLFNGVFNLSGLSLSDDTVLIRRLLNQLHQEPDGGVYYCDNAGAAVRFMTALLAITPGNHLVNGDERLRMRPIAPLVESLRSIGCEIDYSGNQGQLPLVIKGTVPRRKMVTVDASLSSQFVSALLLIAPALPAGMTLTLTSHPTSRPYIAMTCNILKQAGFPVKVSASGRTIMVGPATENPPKKQSVKIERDWSSASYFYELAALDPTKRIRLVGLSPNSIQGDMALMEIFQQIGVKSSVVRSPYHSDVNSIRIQGGNGSVECVKYNFRDCPDLAPAVIVTCAALGIRSIFSGLNTLKNKESDRLQALIAELRDMNCDISLHANQSLYIKPSKLQPIRPVNTYGDHRLVMAFAPLKLLFPEVEIENPELVTKSFPNFWELFNKVVSQE